MEKLQQLLDEGVIEEVFNQLKTGKEAEVWLVSHHGEPVAAKIYKAREFRSFKNDAGYKEGRQVRNTRTQRAMDKGSKFGRESSEEAWKSMESDTMFSLHAAGVRCPKPVMFYDGVLLMEVIGDAEGRVAPRLVEAAISREQAESLYVTLRQEVIKMLAEDVIHGDLSEFNILLGANGPVIIDFPQVITAAKNSQSEKYFRRDLGNLIRFFSGADPSLEGRHAGDADEIWREYVRRDLSPTFVPSGRRFQGGDFRRGGPQGQRHAGPQQNGGPRGQRNDRAQQGPRNDGSRQNAGAPQGQRNDGWQQSASPQQGRRTDPPQRNDGGRQGQRNNGPQQNGGQRDQRSDGSQKNGGQRDQRSDGAQQNGGQRDQRGDGSQQNGDQRDQRSDGSQQIRGQQAQRSDGAQQSASAQQERHRDGSQQGGGPRPQRNNGAQQNAGFQQSRRDGGPQQNAGSQQPPRNTGPQQSAGGQQGQRNNGPQRNGGRDGRPGFSQQGSRGPAGPQRAREPGGKGGRPQGPVVERKPQVSFRPAQPASGGAPSEPRKNDGTGRG